jgi:hypothetical protein
LPGKKHFLTAKTILLDFDGTIAPFTFPDYPGAPDPVIRTVLHRFRDLGLHVVICTARAWGGWGPRERSRQIREVELYMKQHGLPYDEITAEKRPALFLYDDRAINSKDVDWRGFQAMVETELTDGEYGSR